MREEPEVWESARKGGNSINVPKTKEWRERIIIVINSTTSGKKHRGV